MGPISDSAAGDYAALGGEEIVNVGRTLAYLENGFGPPGMTVNGGCACPNIRELAECTPEPYDTPATDPAPWYDASIPESADFAGFYVAEFEGMGSTYTRNPVEKITGGSVLGRLRPNARELRWRGFLFGKSCCAVQYGLRWLTAQIVGTKCVCGGEDLDLLICCPATSGMTPPVTGCGAVFAPAICPPFTAPDAFRTLKNVGLLDGPRILSERKIGCGGACGTKGCADESCIIEIEFSLLAGNPFLYGCPVCLCICEPFPENPPCPDCTAPDATCVEFVKVPPGTLADCTSECPPPADCSADDGCTHPALPTIPPFDDLCFCEPLDPVQFCCDVPADSFGQFFEGAPVIEIFSGANPMRSTTVRFFSNPANLPCCDISDPCNECDSIRISFIPAESTLIIDGTTRQVTLQCGVQAPIPAEHLTVTPFSWPLLSCIPYCICTETEGLIVADDACVTIAITPREM